MTETFMGMSSMPKEAKATTKPGAAEQASVRELSRRLAPRGEDLTGPDGLMRTITAVHGVAGRLGGGDDRAPKP